MRYKERRLIAINWWSSVLWQDIAHLIADYGLLVVAVVIGLESIGLPFPGESVLILAGIFAGTRHELNIFWLIVVAAIAAIVGQAIGYVMGREFGYRLLLRHGPKIIVVARFVPLLRSLAGILAGANRMPWLQFMLANSAGAFGKHE